MANQYFFCTPGTFSRYFWIIQTTLPSNNVFSSVCQNITCIFFLHNNQLGELRKTWITQGMSQRSRRMLAVYQRHWQIVLVVFSLTPELLGAKLRARKEKKYRLKQDIWEYLQVYLAGGTLYIGGPGCLVGRLSLLLLPFTARTGKNFLDH